MIKILIVEDNEYKLSQIKSLFQDDIVLDAQYDCADSTKSAKKLLKENQYDLLILDLVLPLETGFEPMPKNGIGLLNDLQRNSNLKSPFYLFGLTEFDDKKDEYKCKFNDNMWHLINYDATSEDWSDKIKIFVHHLINARKSFLEGHKNIQTRYHGLTALELIEQTLYEFSNTVKKITLNRRKDHTLFEINDEYDVQDLVYVMLKGILPHLKEEEPTPSIGGKFNRIDFIDMNGTLIEIKMMKSKDTQKEFIEQLKIDIQSYYLSPMLKNLIFFIYDPFNKTKDKHLFDDLEGEQTIKGINFNIKMILVH